MYEMENIFFKIGVIDPIQELQPDEDWCKYHFQERIGGKPLNPGQSYQFWPYYNRTELNNDQLFRGSGIFSHTYMERFWPKKAGNFHLHTRQGIRYEYGDLNDLIDLLKRDPDTRQAFLPIWFPEDTGVKENQRVPCTLGYWFKKNRTSLNVTYLIRSCDIVRHFRNDLYLTHLLLKHVSENLGLMDGYISVWIGSLHCFGPDFYHIKKLIK